MPHDLCALARRWMEDNWNRRRPDVVGELLHDDAVGEMEGVRVEGPAHFLEVRAALLDAFPDLAIDVEACIAQGEEVAVRWVLSGTHLGEGLGIPASKRPFRARGSTWFTFCDGRIIGGCDTWNRGELLAMLSAP